jgi:hypothetical protein
LLKDILPISIDDFTGRPGGFKPPCCFRTKSDKPSLGFPAVKQNMIYFFLTSVIPDNVAHETGRY